MSIETTLPYSWLKSVPDNVKALDEVPLFGNPPLFPWELFSKELEKALQIKNLSIHCTDVQWTAANVLIAGFGENPAIFSLTLAPLPGHAYWIFPRENIKRLFEAFTSQDQPEEFHKSWDEEWENQFHQFLALQTIIAFHKTKYDSSISPQLICDAVLPDTPTLCLDIKISVGSIEFFGRLSISPELRAGLKQKYLPPNALTYPPGLSQAVTTTLHFVIGKTSLLRSEWQNISPGDFLLLDSCSLAPGDEKGRVILTVNNTPIFRAKIKDRSLKLLEFPLLQEVNTPMAKHEDDEFDDPFETEDESFPETTEENLEFDDELKPEEEAEEDFEEDLEEKSAPKSPAQAAKNLLTKPNDSKQLVKPEEIPLSISIEIGRIQMTIHQLMQLTPGNMLDLDISTDNGVDLVVNGQCIGKGELLKLGDALGVRITDIA